MPCKDRESQRAFQREWLKKRRAARLAESTCVRCGSRRDLQVDHIDQTKKVSHRIWSWTVARREAELVKCQILCKSCHRTKSTSEIKRDSIGRFLPVRREVSA